jgi:4-hydroxy 2-oxovalerate aldolase
MAFANTLEAIRTGVDIVDCSIYGMGRGSGNLPTEVLIAYLQTTGNQKYNVLPVLNIIDRYFMNMMAESPWGYQLPFMISGMFKCHPYYASELVKRKEYSIEDVWQALEIIEEMDPIGFNRKIIEDLIKKGVLGGTHKLNAAFIPKKPINDRALDTNKIKVPYINRHRGRDFLVLANGPTLKKCHDKIIRFIEKYNPVILGANYLADLFFPDYHAFNNKKRFTMYVDTVSLNSNLLIGENIDETTISEYTDRDYEKLFFENILDNDFTIESGRIQASCRTISVLLLGVAIVMGSERIFAAGMDGYLSKDNVLKGLYYDETLEPDDSSLIVERHRWNERFLFQIDQYIRDEGKEGIHIITPTSHQQFYKGIDNFI